MAQTQRSPHRYDKDRGYVCTFSALVIKSTTAHLFHVGDSRIYRLHPKALEQLTEDHRVRVSSEQSYLGRALGVQTHAGDRLPGPACGSRARCSCWPPTASTNMPTRR